MGGSFGGLKFSVGPGRVRSALPFHRGTDSKRVAPYHLALVSDSGCRFVDTARVMFYTEISELGKL